MPETTERAAAAALERRLKRLGMTGDDADWTDRYLLCEHVVDPVSARSRQRFEAIARFIRDLIAHRWVKTRLAREQANPKRVYYLSMEFLLGRTLNNNIINLAADPLVQRALDREGWDLTQLLEQEPDAGLGNGGLGRLAACFIDSLATLQYSAMGYGLQYQYGIFRQSVRDGYQVEEPDNWLRQPDPWQVARPGKEYRGPAAGELRAAAARRSRSSRTGRRSSWVSRTIGRSSATARAASTRCDCGPPRPPSRSTSPSSHTAISSAP